MEEHSVKCPVHRVSIIPCDAAELDPLLRHLRADLSVNLTAQGNQQFPRGTLTVDGRLDLCKQSLGTDHCLSITKALEHNTQVRSLMLGTDAIGDAGAAAVAGLASVNPHLEVLYLGCNNIGPAGALALGNTLAASAPNITGLWLKRNPLGSEGAANIAHMLRSNQQLRVLDLVNTDLRASGVQAIVDALCSDNHSLQSLYLSGNGLEVSSAADLAHLLREAPHIKALYLSVNRLGDEGALLLAGALRDNHTLHTLELASNGISQQGASALLDAAIYSSLQSLNLGYAPSTRVLGAQANCMGDDGAVQVAHLIGASATLRKLNVTRNSISRHGHTVLFDAALRSMQLTQLSTDRRLPDELSEHLQRNLSLCGEVVSQDQAMIRSVYR
ncbi:hypothetical protein ACO0LF_17200 [Undibacterium sp. Di27W]|uniref:hypothetical protein n=1 Tax=Undibacterium sp. Di27W TaxID=3413036 RepID=UPI003BF454AE